MAHIKLNPELPGILSLFDFRKETAKPLCELAETLLRGPSSLSSGEREIIASYVSSLNNCLFCHSSHGAAAAVHLGTDMSLLEDIRAGLKSTTVTPRMRALLAVAAKVQQGGQNVSDSDIQAARAEGATDLEIHDAVLIAAAFCMYNRYVDGLGTWAPKEAAAYGDMGKRLAETGYVQR
jgi:uncharacterized peroxidase-related enzyme